MTNSAFEDAFVAGEFSRLIRENVSDLIAIINGARQRVWFNDAYCTTLGFTRHELETGDSTAALHPDDIASVRQAFDDSMREGRGRSLQYRMRRRDGTWIWLESTGRVVRGIPGVGDCLVLVARDISQRKERESLQRQARRRLQRQKSALLRLLHENIGASAGWEEALRGLAAAAAETLAAASASVWWLRRGELVREVAWGRFETTLERRPLAEADLVGLHASPVLVVDGTTQPPPAFSSAPAALHAALLREGRLIGLLSIEDSAERNWFDDEESFAESLGTLLVQWLEARDRRRVLEQLGAELDEASSYVRALLPAPLTDGPIRADSLFVSSTRLGGDAFGWRWLDDEHFAVYLLDVCGHGVGAALHSVSALHALRGGNLPGVDFHRPAEVLAGMNRAFPMEAHGGMYFTLWYGVYSVGGRSLRHAAAGHPPALLFTAGADGTPFALGRPAPMIGAWEEATYQDECRILQTGDRLCIFSDGVTEIERPDGTFWPATAAQEALREAAYCEGDLQNFLRRLQRVAENEQLADDASLIRLHFV